MSIARRLHHTLAEYLALEELSPVRHEFFEGEIYAMAGGTPEHAALAAAIAFALQSRLPAGCRVFGSDLRIRVEQTGLSTYPDVSIVCGKVERSDEDKLAATNPVVLVEVTSPSTAEYDRGEKLRHYQTIPSVRFVLIAAHDSPRMTLHARAQSGWVTSEAAAGDSVRLDGLGVTLDVGALYATLSGL